MITLIYGSAATNPMSETELLEILEVSRRNNQQHDITGMLLYSDGNFIQVLEGEEAIVTQVFTKIQKDPRHQGIMVYVKHPIDKRQFANWEMGFVNVQKVDVSRIPGYSNYLKDPEHENKLSDVSYARSFLSIIRENIR